jgi:triphosphoribosyl-dephospho-CoA synthase
MICASGSLKMNVDEKSRHISKCLELAILLEASADKPGNVNRINGFECTRYEHFLASAVAMTSSFELGAQRGIAVSRREIGVSAVAVGQIIKESVVNADAWQRGGNTLLGTAILLSPIAVAAGMASTEEENFDIPTVREKVKAVVESTTPEDAVNLYEAIRIAKPGGLGTSSQLDVNDSNSTDRILKERISLYQIFKIASEYDSISSEWINNYHITFDTAYPSLIQQLTKSDKLEVAIVHTFLKVLAKNPDTLIARKTNAEKARRISSEAEEVLKLGGLETVEGKEGLNKFDLSLRGSSNLLNPGTTADIIATALALCVLAGYRP